MAFIDFKKNNKKEMIEDIKRSVQEEPEQEPEVLDDSQEIEEESVQEEQNKVGIDANQALDLAKYYFARAEYFNNLGNKIIQELE